LLQPSGNHYKVILGDYTYNETDKKLLDFVKEIAKQNNEQIKELTEELQILKDAKANGEQKRTAWVKLKEFLTEHALDIGKIAFKLLEEYLDGLL